VPVSCACTSCSSQPGRLQSLLWLVRHRATGQPPDDAAVAVEHERRSVGNVETWGPDDDVGEAVAVDVAHPRDAIAKRRGRQGRFEYGVLIGAGLLLYVVWVGGTLLGTVIGDLLDPEAIGLDAAFPALFLALLAPYLRSRRALATALVAGGITLVLLPFAPPGVPIVAASLAALIGLLR